MVPSLVGCMFLKAENLTAPFEWCRKAGKRREEGKGLIWNEQHVTSNLLK